MDKGVNILSNNLYLDDMSIGDVFESSEEYELTKEEIISFASQYDPQPFHTDPIAAEDTFFKGLAASGWLTAAISMRLTVRSFPLADGLIGTGVEISWPSPTRVGDRLKVKVSVIDVKPSKSKPSQGIVTYETITTNQHGEVRQKLIARVLSFKK